MKKIILSMFIIFSFTVYAEIGSMNSVEITNLNITNEAGTNKIIGMKPYNINFSMTLKDGIRAGDVYTINGFGPKYHSVNDFNIVKYYYDNNRRFFYYPVSYDATQNNEIVIDGEVIGTFKGNVITFNENVLKHIGGKVNISLGIGSAPPLYLDETDPLFGTEMTEKFYLSINNNLVSDIPVKFVADKKEMKKLQTSNVLYARIQQQPSADGSVKIYSFFSPYKEITEIRDNGNWENDIITVEVLLPPNYSYAGDQSINTASNVFSGDSDKLFDNPNVQIYYSSIGRLLKYEHNVNTDNYKVDFKFNMAPLNDGEGWYDGTFTGYINLNEPNLIDWNTGEILGEQPTINFYINNKLIETKKLTKVIISVPLSNVDAEGNVVGFKKSSDLLSDNKTEKTNQEPKLVNTGIQKNMIFLLTILSLGIYLLYKIFKKNRIIN